jgi:RNA polymerase sigma-B factor
MQLPGVTEVGGGANQERPLLERWQAHRDTAAREQLLWRLLPLVRAAARRYQASGESLDDLIQVASIGALKAIDRFDLDRPTSLRAYAERLVEGELRHHMRDSGGGLLHLPRKLYARGRAASRAAAQLTAQLGRQPTAQEIADALGLTRSEVVDALDALVAAETHSLDTLATRAGEERLGYTERIGADDPRYELVERSSTLQRAWRTLEPRARTCVRLRLAEERTYGEIAAHVGVSPTHAARLVRQSVARLQAVALAEDHRPASG